MKTKKLLTLFTSILAAAFLLGFFSPVKAGTASGEEQTKNDRLIGALITTEYLDLFDTEGYFNDNANKLLSGGTLSPEESEQYQGRLYAVLQNKPFTDEETGEVTSIQEYVFEGTEGFAFYVAVYADEEGSYVGSNSDEAISDGQTAVNVADEGNTVTLSGTVYASLNGPASFYINPIYQTASGEVYAVSGNGMSSDTQEGISFSTTLSEKQTYTSKGETTESGSSVTVTIQYMDPPKTIRIMQFSAEGELLLSSAYESADVPKKLTVEAGAAYIVVETCKNGGESTWELFQKGDETLRTFRSREDGIIVQTQTQISWGD